MDSPGGNAARQQRADSTGSTGSSGSMGRRKSSSLFSSLEQQKRSNDPEQVARRASMHDQKPAPGMIGKWWSSYVHGTGQK
ncbi:uncharacterized protein SPSK_10114 [Sporothrix schenckii 1099-18]|uniref:Conidiation-specific protein 8 n=2 Tax=Sporothrix schenckii TaxID=29908 RepID=U7Q594_SPOS1|nr:uncharacterized protein SPSK_10114 [Sporothrix schenckii 1099-18]ERT03054.1 hypothetical protein HMPREF1624_01359 [Sporothrix schenckii ATCC 58251]KJR84549.1 hypothetical protein SPSK_10114 [Sporothrix schenckii 1099-18]